MPDCCLGLLWCAHCCDTAIPCLHPAAYYTRRSALGLATGLGVGAAFALGAWWIEASAKGPVCLHACQPACSAGDSASERQTSQNQVPHALPANMAPAALLSPSVQTDDPEKHELAHQTCLIAAVLFGGGRRPGGAYTHALAVH